MYVSLHYNYYILFFCIAPVIIYYAPPILRPLYFLCWYFFNPQMNVCICTACAHRSSLPPLPLLISNPAIQHSPAQHISSRVSLFAQKNEEAWAGGTTATTWNINQGIPQNPRSAPSAVACRVVPSRVNIEHLRTWTVSTTTRHNHSLNSKVPWQCFRLFRS